jgi:hypothetical protein
VEPLHFRQGTGDQGTIPLLDQGLLVPRDGIEDPPVRRGQPQLRDRSQERITPSGTSPTGRFPLEEMPPGQLHPFSECHYRFTHLAASSIRPITSQFSSGADSFQYSPVPAIAKDTETRKQTHDFYVFL